MKSSTILENEKNQFSNFEKAQILFSSYNTLKTSSEIFNSLLEREVIDRTNKSNPRVIINDFILKHYPNETSIKATFINKVLLKTKNHVSIFELPIGTSRADLCKINGESFVFEIKTDLDNFNRLSKQMNDYFDVFERVYIICSESKVADIWNLISDDVGIYTYKSNKKGNYTFHHLRKAVYSDKFSAMKQIRLMRKSELANITNMSSTLSRDILEESALVLYNRYQINDIFKGILKQKYKKQWSNLELNHHNILEIDYQWFYRNPLPPELIYF